MSPCLVQTCMHQTRRSEEPFQQAELPFWKSLQARSNWTIRPQCRTQSTYRIATAWVWGLTPHNDRSVLPEAKARINIDRLLEQAGWVVQDVPALNVHAARGVAGREFPLRSGHGFADYLLYVDGKAAGVVEAKPEGHTLTGVEAQLGKYGAGLPDNLPYYIRPLPFLYESTGVETRFTNGLDPQPRSRGVFSFHTPEILASVVGRVQPVVGLRPIAGS